MHKYMVYFNETFINKKGKKVYFYDFTVINRVSCPKDGETIAFHEGYGRLRNYKIYRVFQDGKFVCLVAEETGVWYNKTKQYLH